MSRAAPRIPDVAKRPELAPIGTPAQLVDAVAISEKAIAKRAYEKFLARGRIHGFDRQDWAAAERELRAGAFE